MKKKKNHRGQHLKAGQFWICITLSLTTGLPHDNNF